MTWTREMIGMAMTSEEARALESIGHVAWVDTPNGRLEFYHDTQGNLCRASEDNAIDCTTGHRIGRFECRGWATERFLADFVAMVARFAA